MHKRRDFRIAGAAAVVLAAALGAGLAAAGLLDGPVYPAAADGESLIVMAPFVNYTGGQQGFNVHGRLKDEIDREILAAGLAGVRTVEWPEEIEGEAAAVAAGRRAGATIVIWGEYDSGRVVAVFTIPRSQSEPHAQQVVDLASSPSELPATVNVDLTEEVRYAALLTLGQLYLEQGAFDPAKTVLIQAMASLRFRLGRDMPTPLPPEPPGMDRDPAGRREPIRRRDPPHAERQARRAARRPLLSHDTRVK